MSVLSENKKVYYDYSVLEKIEAGIVLTGQEVKAIRTGKMNLAGSHVILRGEEVFLIGAKIPPYQPKNAPADYDPERSRKLLLKKAEIKHLIGKIKQKGLTLVPLKVYTKNRRLKLEFGIVKGKKEFDKRETIKKREDKRNIDRALRQVN